MFNYPVQVEQNSDTLVFPCESCKCLELEQFCYMEIICSSCIGFIDKTHQLNIPFHEDCKEELNENTQLIFEKSQLICYSNGIRTTNVCSAVVMDSAL